jgi:hypothetical protein
MSLILKERSLYRPGRFGAPGKVSACRAGSVEKVRKSKHPVRVMSLYAA